MELFWLLVLILFVVWLAKRKPKDATSDPVDVNSKSYAQGYWDGYRAHKKEVTSGVKPPQSIDTMRHQQDTPHIAIADSEKPLGQQERLDSHTPESNLRASSYSMGANVNTRPSVVDSAAAKAKHDLQNINTTLYVASFLLVAAVALFVNGALSEAVKFVGVWAITTAFYLAGLILYKSVPRLQPAAVAFVGTGLALLPFTGIAMYNFVLPNAPACWFITSVVGLVAFVLAAVRLKNQVISYLAIAFGISLATSSVAVLDAGLVWYFVVSIIFGSIMTFVAKLKPNWVPECFTKPIYDSNHWIVPLTIVASLLASNGMVARDYWIISLVSTFYYGAVAVSSVEGRQNSIFLTRFLASLTALLMAYDFSSSSWTAVGLTLSAVGILQVAISVVFLPKHIAGDSNNETWLWLGFASQLFAALLVIQDASWASIISGQLVTLLIVSFGVSYMLRRIELSIFGTISLAILPILLCYYVIQPALETQWISSIFLVLASVVIGIRSMKSLVANSPLVRQFLVVNFAVFLVESLAYTTIIGPEWGFAIWSIATLLVYGLMYLERQPWLSLVANGMILTLIVRFVQPTLDIQWVALIFIIFASISLAILSMGKLYTISPTVRLFLVANLGLFIVEALSFTLNIDPNWGFAIWMAATALVYGLIYIERQPWLSIVANVMILTSIVRFVDYRVESHWVAVIFLVLATITLAVRILDKFITTWLSIRPVLVANVVLFLAESLAYTLGVEAGWGFTIWLIASVLLYILVYLEQKPLAVMAPNLAFLVTSYWFVDLIKVDAIWKSTVISWVVFLVFYSCYWLLLLFSKKEYAPYFWWSAIITAGAISMSNLMSYVDSLSITAAVGVIAVASAVAVEGWRLRRYKYIDIAAVLATVAMQRILYVLAPKTDMLVYTHWWSAVVAGLSYMYYRGGRKSEAKTLTYVALTVMSLFTGMAALGMSGNSDVAYQPIFLGEHILVLLIGLVSSRKLFSVWGAVGVILSVVWMIKDLTYLLLALAAFVLIGGAIYALVKQSKNVKS